MITFKSRQKNKLFNGAVGARCLQLWHHCCTKNLPSKHSQKAKYMSFKSHLLLVLTHTQAQTVSYCV